jgi:hypothetical protein
MTVNEHRLIEAFRQLPENWREHYVELTESTAALLQQKRSEEIAARRKGLDLVK